LQLKVGEMVADEYDEITYAKILAAAEEIRAMARNSPAQAAAMFAQAHHLFELAEQIRNDWLRHRGPQAGSRAAPERDPATESTGASGSPTTACAPPAR
jgi:hypothetical protein